MRLLVFFALFLFPFFAFSKVETPNYDFSLKAFETFHPGASLEEIKKTYPKGEIVDQKTETFVMRFYVTHIHYRFPIFVQFYQDKVLDFIARLPQYFSHDLFHKTLITQFGKQDQYIKREESALYIWKGGKDGIKKMYTGACTITCFPMTYAEITLNKPSSLGEYKTLVESFDEAVQEKSPPMPMAPTATLTATITPTLTASPTQK